MKNPKQSTETFKALQEFSKMFDTDNQINHGINFFI